MKRHKSISPMLRNKDFETEGALTDTVIYFYDQHLTWLSQLKPNAKVG